MKPRTRNILIVVGIVIIGFAGLVGYGIYSAYSFFSRMNLSREMPDEIKEPRILKGADFLTKREFFRLTQESLIETIGKSATIKDEKERQKVIASQTAKGIYNFSDLKILNDEVIAVGEFGGFVFDLNGNLKREILFEPTSEKIKVGGFERENYQSRLKNLRIVEPAKNKLGFLSFGSSQGATVFDENGNQIWNYGKWDVDLIVLWEDEKKREERYEKSVHVLEAAVGDLDNDGIAEYMTAVKNDGVRVFDRDGNEKWFQPDEFPSAKIYVLDIDGDGKNEILQLGGDSKIKDGNGKLIKELKGGTSDSALLVSNSSGKKSLSFCNIVAGSFSCGDENEQNNFTAAAPLSSIKSKQPKKVDIPDHPEWSFTDETEDVAYPKAIWVNLQKDKPKYLAVIASFVNISRSNFYLYDEKQNLVYHELLPEDAETIAVIPSANSTEEILIGGKDTIWKFAAK